MKPFEGTDTMEQFEEWFLTESTRGFNIEITQYYYPRKGRLEVSYEYWSADTTVVTLALVARSPAVE